MKKNVEKEIKARKYKVFFSTVPGGIKLSFSTAPEQEQISTFFPRGIHKESELLFWVDVGGDLF